MKRSLFLCIACLLLAIGVNAQSKPMSAEQYKALREMTRRQADTLQLNEHEFIKLLHINRSIMLRVWQEDNRKNWARKEDDKK